MMKVSCLLVCCAAVPSFGACSGPKPPSVSGNSSVEHQAVGTASSRPSVMQAAPSAPRATRQTQCGDGTVNGSEECDDGNQVAGDGCSARCRTEAVQVASNGLQTCIVTVVGGLKCWGENRWGQLGYGDTNNRGDEPGEMGDALPYVDLGGSKAISVAPGKASTCALIEGGGVKCWGGNASGTNPSSMGIQLRPVAFDRRVVLFDASNDLCAVLEDGSVRCISNYACSDLGFARDNCHLRSDEYRLMWTPVLIKDSRRIVQISTGTPDCALLADGAVKCWGAGSPSVGHSWKTMLSGVFKKQIPDVPLGTNKKVTYVASNVEQVCVILDTGEVGCWGKADSAEALGYYSVEKNEAPTRSKDSEDPPEPPQFWHTGLPKKLMRFEAKARRVLPGPEGGCVLLEDNRIKCWQKSSFVAVEELAGPVAVRIDGQFTSAPAFTIKMPRDCRPIDVSMAGNFCVLCDSGCLECWGDNSNGQLGYGDTRPRSEPPEECVQY